MINATIFKRVNIKRLWQLILKIASYFHQFSPCFSGGCFTSLSFFVDPYFAFQVGKNTLKRPRHHRNFKNMAVFIPVQYFSPVSVEAVLLRLTHKRVAKTTIEGKPDDQSQATKKKSQGAPGYRGVVLPSYGGVIVQAKKTRYKRCTRPVKGIGLLLIPCG